MASYLADESSLLTRRPNTFSIVISLETRSIINGFSTFHEWKEDTGWKGHWDGGRAYLFIKIHPDHGLAIALATLRRQW